MPSTPLRRPALDPDEVAPRTGSGYPEPYRSRVLPREKRALGDALGLTRIGVNLTTLVLNLAYGVLSAVRGQLAAAQLDIVLAGGSAIVVWLVVRFDRHFITKQETLESYREEQVADTKMKQFMVEQVQSGKVGIGLGFPAQISPPSGRSH